MRRLVLLLALWASPVHAQVSYPPGVTQPQLSAVQATIPTAATSVPTPEVVGGVAGTAGTYLPGNAVQPRITRSTNCTLDSTGSCSVTWATPMTVAPQVILTPVNPTAAQAIMCNTTATPTVATVSIKCWSTQTTLLSLAIVTSGLTLVPAVSAASGTVVQISAIPPSQ